RLPTCVESSSRLFIKPYARGPCRLFRARAWTLAGGAPILREILFRSTSGAAMRPALILAVLDREYHSTRGGTHTPVMLWGAPGVGKSQMVAQVAARHGVPV